MSDDDDAVAAPGAFAGFRTRPPAHDDDLAEVVGDDAAAHDAAAHDGADHDAADRDAADDVAGEPTDAPEPTAAPEPTDAQQHPAPAPLSAEDRRVRHALIAGLLIVATLTGLVGWLSFRTAQSDRADLRRDEYLAVAGRFAVDLTTVDYQNPQADVQRVLDAATGEFYQRFADRAPLLIETVTREHAQAVSSVSAIGVQSQSRTGDRARVLVALSVASAHLGGLEERPHEMRMRLTMNWVDDRAKVSNVEYVR